jgi:uncharacterized LabA/DUF88 family protein
LNNDKNNPRLAVLIDADNTFNVIPIIDELFEEISKFGDASVRRIYGDWTQNQLSRWKEILPKHAIQPMQQYANTKGKNATDSALIIDAMDLLYSAPLDGFCIVSSDSDFTRLAIRFRESGKLVYGFGERKTPESLRAACNKFIYFENLLQNKVTDNNIPNTAQDKSKVIIETKPSFALTSEVNTLAPVVKKTSQELIANKKLIALIRSAIEITSDETGWAQLGGVGSIIEKQATDFDPRTYGYKKLSDLVSAIELFEVVRDNMRILIREKVKK